MTTEPSTSTSAASKREVAKRLDPYRVTDWRTIGNLRWRLEKKTGDLWIGVYHDTRQWRESVTREVWICVVPMLPLHLRWTIRRWTESDFDPEGL